MTGGQKAAKGFGLILACIIVMSIVGAIIAGISFAGKRFGFIKTGDSDRSSYEMSGDDFYKTFEDVEKLVIDSSAIPVEVKAGSENSVRMHNVDDAYEVSYSNGTLSIKPNDHDDFFDWIFDDELFSERYVLVYIKEGTLLETIEADTGSGRVSFGSLATKEFKLDGGSGSVTLTDVNAGRSVFSFGSGGADLTRFKTISFDCNASSGSVSMENSEVSDASIDSGSGRFFFSGKLEKSLDIDSGSGSVSFELEGDAGDWGFKCRAGSGGIYINGDKNDSITVSGPDPDKKISIDGGSGRVSVDFKK